MRKVVYAHFLWRAFSDCVGMCGCVCLDMCEYVCSCMHILVWHKCIDVIYLCTVMKTWQQRGQKNITEKLEDLRVIVYRKWVRAAANYLQTLLYFLRGSVLHPHITFQVNIKQLVCFVWLDDARRRNYKMLRKT